MSPDPELPLRVEAAGRVLEVSPGGTFSYLTADGKVGWRHLGFQVAIAGEARPGRLQGVDAAGRQWVLTLAYPPSALTERVTIRLLDDPPALTVERVAVNGGAESCEVGEVRTVLAGPESSVVFDGAAAGAMQLVHVSNVRESFRLVGRRTGPLVGSLPYWRRTIGDSEGHPFPALAVGRGGDYLLEASLQRDVFIQMWEIEGDYRSRWPAGICRHYAAVARDGRRQPVRIDPGAQQRLSWLFYQVRRGCDLADLYDDYLTELNRHYDLRGRDTPLLHEALYCTWNYGLFHDISADLLAAQAELIARRLPGVKHFLIDDGYQRAGNRPTYDLGAFYPDPGRNYDRAKFPDGMRAVSDMLRERGLKPAIWWSPALGRGNDLVREHPEWLCFTDTGESWTMDATGPEAKAALDFSVPAARQFVQRVLETLFVDWGFEGMKLDFCTYPFDLKDIRFRHGGGVRWWNWFLAAIGEHVGREGFFQLCGGAPQGDPFLGRWCDNHRVGGDIGSGDWAAHRAVSRAPLPLLGVGGRRTLLMDVDSAGVRADLSDDENLSRLAFCYVTQGLMGIGGDLTRLSDAQLSWLDRITRRPDRGHKVRCPDRRAFTGEPLPEVLCVQYPPDGPTASAGVSAEVGFFNWDDEPKTIGRALERLGIAPGDRITDFWTGEPVAPSGEQLVVALRPRASRLLQVHPA